MKLEHWMKNCNMGRRCLGWADCNFARSQRICGGVKSVALPNVEPALFCAGRVANVQSQDVDDLSAATVGWNRACTQLRPGRFFGSVAIAQTSRMQLTRVRWNTAIQARGEAPSGTRAIAVPIGSNPAPSFCGVKVGGREIVTEQEGIEVEFRGADTCEFLMVSIDVNLLQRHAAAVWGEPFESHVADGKMKLGDFAARTRLASAWASVLASVQRDPGALSNPHIAGMIEHRVINELVGIEATRSRRLSPVRRQMLARRAEEFLRDRMDEIIRLTDVCEWVDASERSLHLGFFEQFGMSPMAYLKTLRMNEVRRRLRDAPSGRSVTDVAMSCGFLHLGRFSVDYARFFGERPSATLRHLVQ